MVRQCSETGDGSCEIFLGAFDFQYELLAIWAPDWGAIFEDRSDIGSVISVRTFQLEFELQLVLSSYS